MGKLILEEKFLRELDSLCLLSKKVESGHFQGERRGSRAGSGLEFIDYQPYQVGDDYRYIDWHLFSRFEQLFIKLFVEEKDLRVHLLIDKSFSMSTGVPSKIEYAKKLAAALGYIALVNFDRVGITSFTSCLEESLPPRRGKLQILELFHFLEKISSRGETNFNFCLNKFASRERKSGVAIVISDLLDEKGYQEGLLSLRTRGWEISLIHILEEREVNPPEEKGVVLVDKETHKRIETEVTPSTIKLYQKALEDFFKEIENFCEYYQIKYLRTLTSLSLSSLIFRNLRRKKVLK